jgi:hypothetical protein
MLNELFELARSQRQAGITNRDSWYGKYKPCPKGTTVRVLLDENGDVADFEVISDISQVEAIRKYEPANGQSFPAFNIKPLFWAGNKELREKLKNIKKKMKEGKAVTGEATELMNACNSLWSDSEKKTLGKCFELAKQFNETIADIPKELSCVVVLAQRLARLAELAESSDEFAGTKRFFDGITHAAIRRIGQGDKTAIEWLDKLLLCANEDAEKAKKISIVCDLSDRSAYPYPPTHDKVQRWVNSKLMQSDIACPSDVSDIDAFGGVSNGTDDKFPPATLPRLGSVTLRAMNSESPCQNRYGRSDAASFCVGKDMRQDMKDSLEWLGKEERKNLTWRDVSGVCGYTKRDGKSVPVPGVLFAYPSILGGTLPPVPAMFAGEEDAADPDGSGFAAMAKRVVDGLSGIMRETPDAEIRVFVLTKADKARTKLLLSKHYVASRIPAAAEEWKKGCQNIPKICLNIGIGKEEKAVWIVPSTPFPTEVVGCLNVVWYREGGRAEQVSGVNIAEGLSLLLETPPYIKRTAGRLLNVALRNTSTLFLALGHADHRTDGSFTWNKNTKPHAKDAGLLPCIMGLLLDKLGHRKGDYMYSASFLVGQMMSLADTLHKEYCRKVRASRKEDKTHQNVEEKESGSGGLPRQLIGNAAMSIAMDNPTAGLARLSERILIYQAWANTSSGDIGYAGWALGEYRRISEELGKMNLPDQSADADKSQMLLGYLSRISETQEDGKR